MKTKLTLIFTVVCCMATAISWGQQNQNPYAVFGSEPYIAGAEKADEALKVLVIENIADGSTVARLEHNTLTGVVTSFDIDGNIVGARQLREGERAWPSVDPLADKYYSFSPYAYTLNNPVNAIDPDGKVVIFVNGNHFGDGATGYRRFNEANRETNWAGTRDYWVSKSGYGFDQAVMNHLGDHNAIYRDGGIRGFMGLANPGALRNSGRTNHGFSQGMMDAERVFAGLARDENGNFSETIKVISHSMGGAYAQGYIEALNSYADANGIQGYSIDFHAAFAPYQPGRQQAVNHSNIGHTLQYSHSNDKIAKNKPIPGAIQMNTSGDANQGHSIFSFGNQIMTLPQGRYKIENGQVVPY